MSCRLKNVDRERKMERSKHDIEMMEKYFPLTPNGYGEGIYGRTEVDTELECKWCPYKKWSPIDNINYSGFETETPNSVEKYNLKPYKIRDYPYDYPFRKEGINVESTENFEQKNLPEEVMGIDGISNFNQWLKLTGLDVMLRGEKTFTVFAPTDEAVSKIDPSVINGLANNLNNLRLVLLNHILPYNSNVDDMKRISQQTNNVVITINENPIKVTHSEDQLYVGVNNIKVLDNVFSSDNNVYLIDGILLPSTFSGNPLPENPESRYKYAYRTDVDEGLQAEWCPYKTWAPVENPKNNFDIETPDSVENFQVYRYNSMVAPLNQYIGPRSQYDIAMNKKFCPESEKKECFTDYLMSFNDPDNNWSYTTQSFNLPQEKNCGSNP